MVTENQEPIKVFKLDTPYSFGSKEITKVKFLRRPKAKDIKKVDIQAMSSVDTMRVLANITDLSIPEIEEMDLDDFNILSQELLSFLPRTREAGNER